MPWTLLPSASRLSTHRLAAPSAPANHVDMTPDGVRVLYLSYDGMTDDIGQAQVLPYLLGSARLGHSITLVSFEKADRMERFGEATRARLQEAGIDWVPERFRSSPPVLSKLFDQLAMARAARRALRRGKHDIVHARSYIAGRGALVAMRSSTPFLFDMRGFWADQRREGGRWRDDSLLGRFLYRRWKSLEARMIARADHIVVLAEAARARVDASDPDRSPPVSIIPCCADFSMFALPTEEARRRSRAALGLPETALVIAWLGSLGTVYRPDLHFRLFDRIRSSGIDCRLLFIGRHDPADLVAQATASGVTVHGEELAIRACSREEVPSVLAAADLGSCFIVPGGSSDGVSPTKLAEMFACGLPVFANAGVGDVAAQIAFVDGGHVLEDGSEAAMASAAASVPRLLALDRDALRERARRILDLPGAVHAYDRIYRHLDEPQHVGPTA